MSEGERQIRALIDERIAAIKSKDAARAIACLGDEVVAFELAPPLSISASAARDEAGFQAWLDAFAEIAVEVRDLQIAVDGQVGFAHALHHLTGQRRDGRPVILWMRSTLCFRKEAAGWQIVHAHTSVPMKMDGSFLAAVDLQP